MFGQILVFLAERAIQSPKGRGGFSITRCLQIKPRCLSGRHAVAKAIKVIELNIGEIG